MLTLGEMVVAARGRLKMTQDTLAERAGVARAYIANIEAGRRTPSRPVLQSLVTILDLDPRQALAAPVSHGETPGGEAA